MKYLGVMLLLQIQRLKNNLMMTIMNLIETIVKKGKDFIDTITLTRKLRISRDEHLLFLEKNF